MKELHIFNGFLNPYGGSEQETLMLYQLLKKTCNVQLWAVSSRASQELIDAYAIKRINVFNGSVPNGGTYIFLGSHWRNRYWASILPKPTRLIYVFNTFHPKILRYISRHPFWLHWPKTEVVVISQFQRELLKIDAVIHPSPIDISRFRISERKNANFTNIVIGRMSRDVPEKFNLDDIPLYATWLEQGHKIILQGGTILNNQIAPHNNLVLLPEGAFPAEAFFHELDIFYYRSGSHIETFGRVVFEAMASGIPVVCHEYGGYAEHIQHGVNGYLFKTNAQAQEIVNTLCNNPELRHRIGRAARVTVENLFSDAALNERLEFYKHA